ncbi:hypothetical protein O4106_15705, partial [Rhodococcus pyridinivorans]|nr:hypothetical protein [Rhodococcus pyridinivorans]MCZ4627175.1 hypothetical protein [Rhodococcus pyridinivorans]MCZ4648286.1 hypothetical protein [Rhodococcus pyridinivorans]MDJ0481094.1 hypothetical protein [Rhodococcus pyridinivorans]
MDPPVTRYIQRDGAALAYQIVGEGPHPIAWFFEDMMHPDLMWTDPHFHYNFERWGVTSMRMVYELDPNEMAGV